jgi:adenosylcobinamide-phosphate synthase
MVEIGTILCIAFVLDILLGDPRYGVHPVRMIGLVIHRFEQFLRGTGCSGKGGGILLAAGTIGSMLLSYLWLQWLSSRVHPTLPLLLDLFLAYSFLALGDLLHHVRPVAAAIERGELDAARQTLSLTVGRDVSVLDRDGIARAAIETLAENFVDGFLSPLFWYIAGGTVFLLLGGNPLRGAVGAMLLFKCVSTLDSMVGYKDDRYLLFGRAGARLDDLMNLIPARMSILFLWVGGLLAGLNSAQGMRAALRDRLKHESPNSAHPESFAAGALGIRLGGPTRYREGWKVKPWLGEGESEVHGFHVRKAMALIQRSAWSAMAVPILFTAALWLLQSSILLL